MSDSPAVAPKRSGFGAAFLPLCVIEAFERLAYFGIRAVVPIYIMQATEPGGLQLTAAHKGWIYMWWAIFQSFLPMVTGGYADRFGYKRMLAFSVAMNVTGYLLMAFLHSYEGFFLGIIVLAIGTAFFKPSLQGSLAQNLTKENSSLGWGIFYWTVNVGAFGAPVIATIILGQPHSAAGWRNLFIASAIYTSFNMLLLLTFKDVPSGASKTESLWGVFKRTIVNIAEPRLIAFLLIMSCFWLMMYQLWDLHPNFIEDWVDSASIASYMPFSSWVEFGDRGLIRVPQQILLNLNAGLIILLVVPISWLVRRMRTLSAMLIGMAVATIGIVVSGFTGNGWILLLGIVFFSLGEMLTGPKKNEYLGLIAPPGKKGLYLGYVNIPVGLGVGLGSWLAGHVYDQYGEKATLALKELASQQVVLAGSIDSLDWSDSLELAPELTGVKWEDGFRVASESMGLDAEAAADRLRMLYKYDQGHTINLILLDLATRDRRALEVRKNLLEWLGKQKDEAAKSLAKRLGSDSKLKLSDVELARFTSELPDWLGESRGGALALLRYWENDGKPADQVKQDAELREMVWSKFGDDPAVLNNLGLCYLAQATDRIERAVLEMEFANPVKDIPAKTGVSRSKSFLALSIGTGADSASVDSALAALNTDPQSAPFVYLMNQAHRRFTAVARKNWSNDSRLLDELVLNDSAALAAASDGGALPDGWHADSERVQRALDAKNWTASPEHAARVLGISIFQARGLVAVDIANSAKSATRLLWDKYHPQYMVWTPFAGIGVIAIISLAIFGQRAKKWADMNA